MIPAYFSPIANHLWQSTLFAVAAALLTLLLRKNRAATRYWIWLAASVKFLIPFSLLVAVGSQFEWRNAPAAAPELTSAVEQLSEPFSALALPTMTAPIERDVYPILLAVWLCGVAAVISIWGARWRRLRATLRAASPLQIDTPIKVMSSRTLMEPGVFGIFRPVLLLPQGIAERLTAAQLRAILAHELCHVRRRDNLAAAVHMVVEAIFWFHPLVWWVGARLVDERERACDEEVVGRGSEPEVYAEGILSVCKFYVESPLACAAGVTGSHLKKRIEAIMTNRVLDKLTLARKLLLAAAGIAAVAGPILIGLMNAPESRAQAKAEALTFEVASIKPSDPDSRRMSFQLAPGGGLNAVNVGLKQLIAFAYEVPCGRNCDTFISGGPGWIDSLKFDILAKAPPSAEATADIRRMTMDQRKVFQQQLRQRVQALLAERFQLAIHRETKEVPVYALVVAKNGPKFKESLGEGSQMLRGGRGEMIAERVPLEMLAINLAGQLGRPVVDRTGLNGRYDFKLEWTPEPDMTGGKLGAETGGEKPASAPDISGPSIFTALQEQLGLKLESTRGPAEIIIIDRAEKPTAN